MLSFFILLFAVSQVAVSQSITRLYIPGFDAQAVVGNIIGVDGGRTTWSLHDQKNRTATLIAGVNFATATFSAPGGTVTEKACSLTLGLALCATSAGLESAIAVETPRYLPVQVAAVQPTPVPSQTPSPQAPSTSQGPSQTSENPAAQTTSSGACVAIELGSLLPTCLFAVLVIALL